MNFRRLRERTVILQHNKQGANNFRSPYKLTCACTKKISNGYSYSEADGEIRLFLKRHQNSKSNIAGENIYSRPGAGKMRFIHRGFCAEDQVPGDTRSVSENRGE